MEIKPSNMSRDSRRMSRIWCLKYFIVIFFIITICIIKGLFKGLGSPDLPLTKEDQAEEPIPPLPVSLALLGAEVDPNFLRIMNRDQEDPRVVDYIKSNHLIGHSVGLPVFECGQPLCNGTDADLRTFKALGHAVLRILDNKSFGTFVECRRSSNGEYLSQSLYLENNFGWKGLIIQPDPVLFERLMFKRRRSFISQTCLSEQKHAFILYKVLGNYKQPLLTFCYPIFSFARAIGVDQIDFLSLGLNGHENELEILKMMPSKLNVRVISIEVSHLNKAELAHWMAVNNYVLIAKYKYLTYEDYLIAQRSLIK